jgi:hypothetical protein
MYKYPQQPISITSTLILFATLTMNLGAAFGKDDPNKTYRCTAKDAVVVEENGTLDKDDPRAKIAREYFDQMVITVPSGRVTFPNSHKVDHDRVVQRTSVDEDYVLISSLHFKRNKLAANATTDFIRLRPAAGPTPATFVAFRLTSLVTGTCEIVP